MAKLLAVAAFLIVGASYYLAGDVPTKHQVTLVEQTFIGCRVNFDGQMALSLQPEGGEYTRLLRL